MRLSSRWGILIFDINEFMSEESFLLLSQLLLQIHPAERERDAPGRLRSFTLLLLSHFAQGRTSPELFSALRNHFTDSFSTL